MKEYCKLVVVMRGGGVWREREPTEGRGPGEMIKMYFVTSLCHRFLLNSVAFIEISNAPPVPWDKRRVFMVTARLFYRHSQPLHILTKPTMASKRSPPHPSITALQRKRVTFKGVLLRFTGDSGEKKYIRAECRPHYLNTWQPGDKTQESTWWAKRQRQQIKQRTGDFPQTTKQGWSSERWPTSVFLVRTLEDQLCLLGSGEEAHVLNYPRETLEGIQKRVYAGPWALSRDNECFNTQGDY